MDDYFIAQDLHVGEKILWQGRPASGLKLRSSDFIHIPFSLFWGGFAFFWEYEAITQVYAKHSDDARTIFFPIWGIPFVVIGIYLIIGRFFVDAWIRARTEYAVTNERAIIITRLWSLKTKFLNLKSIPEISVNEKSDRSGTISFGGNDWGSASYRGRSYPRIPAFEMIQDVKNVSTLIQKIQQGVIAV